MCAYPAPVDCSPGGKTCIDGECVSALEDSRDEVEAIQRRFQEDSIG